MRKDYVVLLYHQANRNHLWYFLPFLSTVAPASSCKEKVSDCTIVLFNQKTLTQLHLPAETAVDLEESISDGVRKAG